VRVVAATNADLEDLVQQGQFRSDLYYRVGVATVNLPPLRERKDEIPALAALFLDRYSAECGRSGLRLADDFIAALVLYHWPGNIRQLANEVRRCIAMADDGQVLTAKALAPVILELWQDRPAAVTAPVQAGVKIGLDQTLSNAVGELEEKFIQHAMDATGGRVADAARLLGLSRKGLFLKRRRRGMVQP
jgi:DNA-binding NtrC family response regulator